MKRLFYILLFSLTAPLLHATPDLSTARSGPTPYDPYLRPVNAVFKKLNGQSPSFATVSTLVKQGYSFKYIFDSPYLAASPDETASRKAGDCKAKSLWLAQQMNDPSVLYVIGKARRSSRISHAWLMWKNGGEWWILDPTNAAKPIPAKAVDSDSYLVSYSYDRNGSYCHSTPARSRRMVGGHKS
jgi:hypothetical protein